MKTSNPPVRVRRSKDWCPQEGETVEVRQWGTKIHAGIVEALMPDGSGFWLAADAVQPRIFVHRDYSDIELWS